MFSNFLIFSSVGCCFLNIYFYLKHKFMKNLLRIFLLVILVLSVMFSCRSGKPIVTTNAENNQTYKIDYLFEHDGCKVYRFQDMDRYVYFSNCSGNVTALTNDSTKARVETIVRVK